MDSRVIAELILHLGRIASGDGLVGGLTPGQWGVLRYFARANRFSRMPSAFAAFQGTTRGTASQAIKSLVAQGYLRQTRSETDGRSVRLDYCFVSASMGAAVGAARIDGEAAGSDHQPLWVEIDLD